MEFLFIFGILTEENQNDFILCVTLILGLIGIVLAALKGGKILTLVNQLVFWLFALGLSITGFLVCLEKLTNVKIDIQPFFDWFGVFSAWLVCAVAVSLVVRFISEAKEINKEESTKENENSIEN